MVAIREIQGRMVLDSRGFPTVEADCSLEDGSLGTALVPSGASTGEAEALELRDGGPTWGGKGVEKALHNLRTEIAPLLVGCDALDQQQIDRRLCEADGTANKSRFGANAILAASMATCRAAANSCRLPLYRYIGGPTSMRLPIPLLNVINGGAHADNAVDVQEFMLAPTGFDDFPDALRAGVEVYHVLKKRLRDKGLVTAVGDEGGFAPDFDSDEMVLEELTDAIHQAGYTVGHDQQFTFALDVAASELFRDGKYHLGAQHESMTTEQMVDYWAALADRFPFTSIEDGLDEEDWSGWTALTARLPGIRMVGDDLFATDPKRITRGIEEGAGNALLVKLNQIGTVSETLQAIQVASEAGFRIIISHRSGETEDDLIADLAVATGAGWIKTGAPCRSERNAKYNRLLRIHEQLGDSAQLGPLQF
ncbi:MAG: phosphopyruvate hydratase [Planctomycetota bacterium]|nr:phosphopyruvate hydratase [Planctomycetota bacterium]